MPSVSVIVPVYNVEPYVARFARSLFGQTIKDIEYIFVDDCSPDRSMAIIKQVLEDEYPERMPQVKVFRMPQNSGQAKVRMQGLSMATGDYVIHCDSDDDVDADAYRKMYEKAIRENFDIVVCDYYLVKGGTRTARSQYAPMGMEIDAILTGKVMGSLWSRMIKRSLLDGIVSPVGDMTEDVVITIQALIKSKRIGYIPEPLYSYFLRDSSITMSKGTKADIARWKGYYANTQLVVNLLASRKGIQSNHPSIVYYKYRTRVYLQKYVHIPEYYRMWRNTFPEVDNKLLFVPQIPLDEKFWYLLIRFHLYHPWKLLSGKHKRK